MLNSHQGKITFPPWVGCCSLLVTLCAAALPRVSTHARPPPPVTFPPWLSPRSFIPRCLLAPCFFAAPCLPHSLWSGAAQCAASSHPPTGAVRGAAFCPLLCPKGGTSGVLGCRALRVAPPSRQRAAPHTAPSLFLPSVARLLCPFWSHSAWQFYRKVR